MLFWREDTKEIGLQLKNHIDVGEPFTKENRIFYEVIDETNQGKYSFWKGALEVALLGGFGAIAGIGGKKKEYLMAIEWPHNALMKEDKSLICIDERYYKTFVRSFYLNVKR